MTSPLPFPDWVPWWVHLVTLLAIALFLLIYLALPFSVFGVKARLENLEAHLDEIQGELRNLALRLPDLAPGYTDPPPRDPRPYDDRTYDDRGYVDPYGRPPPDPRAEPRYEPRPEPRIVRPQGRTEPRLY